MTLDRRQDGLMEANALTWSDLLGVGHLVYGTKRSLESKSVHRGLIITLLGAVVGSVVGTASPSAAYDRPYKTTRENAGEGSGMSSSINRDGRFIASPGGRGFKSRPCNYKALVKATGCRY
ncbi:MAG: hypothetical protein ACRDLB_13955 [Actinomycetota bacterium]